MPNQIELSKKAREGMVQSAFMLAAFTVFWAAFLFWGFGLNALSAIGCAVFVVAAVFLFRGAAKARRTISQMPDGPADPEDKRAGTRWTIIFSVQGGVIGAACAVLGVQGQYQYIVPAVVLIVGAHYFPLGTIYRTKIHFIVGAVVVLVAVFGIVSQALGLLDIRAIGICAIAAALSTIILGAYILRMLR